MKKMRTQSLNIDEMKSSLMDKKEIPSTKSPIAKDGFINDFSHAPIVEVNEESSKDDSA